MVAVSPTVESDSSKPNHRLNRLRQLLLELELNGVLIRSADEHLNEYLPEARKRREWLTGFTGSAGDVLVSQEQAWLLVDSRYYEQAEQEVNLAHYTIVKLGLTSQPTFSQLVKGLGAGFRLGLDPLTIPVERYRAVAKDCREGSVILVPMAQNIVDQLRQQEDPIALATGALATGALATGALATGALATGPVYRVDPEFTGATVADKLDRIRQELRQSNVSLLPLTKLDQIAWTFNLRGSDIPFNPVFISYALITLDRAALFTDLSRIDQSVVAPEVELYNYSCFFDTLQDWVYEEPGYVGVDPKHITQGVWERIGENRILEINHPVEGLKSQKNSVELEQMRRANQQASRAKIRTLAWVDHQIEAGQSISEADVAATIETYYREEPGWCGLSFTTIAATGSNSSIVHYGTPSSTQLLRQGHLFLLDSGSQYLGGTTDDTRTIVIGEPTPDQKQRYTEVLKSHIHCAQQRFPRQTTGAQLDGITRWSLWQVGLDFGHGTGHGVGAFLNVHEGPNGISKRVQTQLKSGMINSIEPGYYEPGWGGIRLENLYVVEEDPEQAGWFRFAPLTWIPFSRRLIADELLTEVHRDWLAWYHQHVFKLFCDSLSRREQSWLTEACR